MPRSDVTNDPLRSFHDLARELLDLPGAVRVVAIDGHGGAGKSTFADRLVHAMRSDPSRPEVVLLHTDEFARPDQPVAWWPRLHAVIERVVTGQVATFESFDWTSERLLPERSIQPPSVLVVEGVSSSRAEWRHHVDFTIWVEANAEICRARGLKRDGTTAAAWDRAFEEEQTFFAGDGARSYADLVVDTGVEIAAPETGFAVQ